MWWNLTAPPDIQYILFFIAMAYYTVMVTKWYFRKLKENRKREDA